jgi:hypothetical protein
VSTDRETDAIKLTRGISVVAGTGNREHETMGFTVFGLTYQGSAAGHYRRNHVYSTIELAGQDGEEWLA